MNLIPGLLMLAAIVAAMAAIIYAVARVGKAIHDAIGEVNADMESPALDPLEVRDAPMVRPMSHDNAFLV